jgi:adenylylsulfate kinase-like enzyme
VDPRLIVIRGNSGSGKTSIVEAIRTAHGRGVAWIEQDHVRRIIFQELDQPDGANIQAIGQLAQHALDRGYHAVVEGIMPKIRYGEMLKQLRDDHAGSSYFYYLDIPLEETIRRHATRPKASAFTAEEMATWFHGQDLLDDPQETVIDQSSSLETTVKRILTETDLLRPKI